MANPLSSSGVARSVAGATGGRRGAAAIGRYAPASIAEGDTR